MLEAGSRKLQSGGRCRNRAAGEYHAGQHGNGRHVDAGQHHHSSGLVHAVDSGNHEPGRLDHEPGWHHHLSRWNDYRAVQHDASFGYFGQRHRAAEVGFSVEAWASTVSSGPGPAAARHTPPVSSSRRGRFCPERAMLKMKKYTLPELPYPASALEPHISGRIMTLHHDKHHKAYVDGANKALRKASRSAQ